VDLCKVRFAAIGESFVIQFVFGSWICVKDKAVSSQRSGDKTRKPDPKESFTEVYAIIVKIESEWV
jgi:hypothetical protein